MSPEYNDEFDDIIEGGYTNSPYGRPTGIPADSIPQKPGLTKRGKVALAVSATVIAGGSLLTWQHYSVQSEANGLEAQKLALKQQELRIQELKEINKATATQKKQQATEDAARSKFVDACVQADKGLVGKQMGVTYSKVVADCQAQYTSGQTGMNGADMAVAGSSTDTASDSGGGINPTGLLALAAGGGLLIVLAANRTKKVHTA